MHDVHEMGYNSPYFFLLSRPWHEYIEKTQKDFHNTRLKWPRSLMLKMVI
jgi:hypothetical protein